MSELFDARFLEHLAYLKVVARKVYAGRARGERRTRRAGAGLEFADHRDYQSGDDLRYLDWNIYGRLDRLLVRLFDEDEDLHVHFLLDASRSMAPLAQAGSDGEGAHSSKFDAARRVVAALSYIGLCGLDRVSVTAFGGARRESLPPRRGRGQIFPVLDFLRELEPDGATDLRGAVAAFVHRAPRRGLVVLVSDFYDPAGYREALQRLRHHRYEPLLIQVVEDPAATARATLGDVELYDCETGEARELTLSPQLSRAYERAQADYCEELRACCAAMGVPSVAASADVPFDQLVLRVLRHGGFLR